ncbi:DUF6191 domain-containing protein [Streptomyces sp. WMMB 322]|uniref:DUF6191 domain-containing protein n=1 Tax=Streptomyces sp. WMMB 322 TaxID=1286821 RepID=UPI0006E21F09|nr:DUF6191 domain-containing protein [Streptomyces sp. WMMB 322]SCK34671.1 hypothetical protein H180DRAFT_02855 [Streptomyces sp. WMMB 322]
MDIAGSIFHPSQQHAQHEQQRLAHTYVVEGTHEPGCGPVDLGSGRIVIALQDQHAILPARPKLEDDSAGEDSGADGPPDLL